MPQPRGCWEARLYKFNADTDGNCFSSAPRLVKVETMEALMVTILLVGVVVVLAFLCLAGPDGPIGPRHRD